MGTEKSGRLDELDAFWDLSDMMPRKKQIRHIQYDTEPVSVFVGDDGKPSDVKISGRESTEPLAVDADAVEPETLLAEDKEPGRQSVSVSDPAESGMQQRKERLQAAKNALAAAEKKYTAARMQREAEQLQRGTCHEKGPSVPVIAVREVPSSGMGKVTHTADFSAQKEAAPAENEEEVPVSEYCPQHNPMLNRIRVFRWPSRYTFYGRFRADALALQSYPVAPCDYVPFFSFMPFPKQLDAQQRAYYLFWRSELMQDHPLRADFSYILLLIYEIINLPDLIKPKTGIHLLCLIWKSYRGLFPKLDQYLTEWVCDYCLIHSVMPALSLLRDFYQAIIDIAAFKEFYIGCGSSAGEDPYAKALFAYASDYNWHQSKFITPENEELFETHMYRAFMAAFDCFNREKERVPGAWQACRKSRHMVVTRYSYSGALCAYDQKRKITVEYKSCMRSPELRFLVTDLMKYIENQIRSLLGIKSRFHVQRLDPQVKSAIDRYFAPYRRKAVLVKKEQEIPEYERQYDAVEQGFDAEKAMKIEAMAWNTTDLLTAAFSQEDSTPMMSDRIRTVQWGTEDAIEIRESGAAAAARTEGETAPGSREETIRDRYAEPAMNSAKEMQSLSDSLEYGLHENTSRQHENTASDEVLQTAFGFLLDGNIQAFSAYAARLNMLPETLAERLNDAAYERLGDVAVETDGSGDFFLLPDYREEIEAWMNR